MPSEATNPNRTPENIDLYCLTCGYNLRGLSGDLIRCPECGYMNQISDLKMSDQLLIADLGKMKLAPTVCAFASLFSFISLLLILSDLIRSHAIDNSTLFFALISMIIWIAGMVRFHSYCLGKPGWINALAKHHLYCFLIIAHIGFILLLFSILMMILGTGLSMGILQFIGAIALTLGAFFLLFYAADKTGKWATNLMKDMDQLHRETAIKRAKDGMQQEVKNQNQE